MNKLVIIVLAVALAADIVTGMMATTASPVIPVVPALMQENGVAWVIIPKGSISSGTVLINFNLFPGCSSGVCNGCPNGGPIGCYQPTFIAGTEWWNFTGTGPGPLGFAEPSYVFPQNQTIWAAMPNATTEVFGTLNDRIGINTTYVTRIQITVNVLSASASKLPAKLAFQWSNNNGANWHNNCHSVQSNCPSIFLNQTGIVRSAWVQSDGISANIGNVIFRLIGTNGNNTSVSIASMRVNFVQPVGFPAASFASINVQDTDLTYLHAEVSIFLPQVINVNLNVSFFWKATETLDRPGLTGLASAKSCNVLNTGTATAPIYSC